MGRNGKQRRKNHSFAEKRRKKAQESGSTSTDKEPRSYPDIVKENANFEEYYKAQKICKDDEWSAFIKALKDDLPAAFRVTGSRAESEAFLKIIVNQFFEPIEGEAAKVEAMALPWYPDRLAWQMKLSRKEIRRSETLSELHNFLVSETDIGTLSRQEVVSMIPPLVLGVEPHHKVLDMCAAPGSKTAQIIESLHSNDDEGKLPSGIVVANDVDNKRCYMLVHQAKRLNSPCVVITNHDATAMPNFTITKEDGTQGMMKFDRVLCDVPCSGDGTLRKNPDVWQKWNAANGNNLHGMQFRIAKRGAELLTVGGKLVYSTCSFNPVENEAVVHRLLLESEGALTLSDIKLPGLKCSPGLSHWTPMARDLTAFSNFESVPVNLHTQIRPSLFPPTPEKAAELHLEKCVRILPHVQDTGGFFVALIEKHRPLPWEAAARPKVTLKSTNGAAAKLEEASTVASEEEKETNAVPNSPPKKKFKVFGYKEDPFYFFTEDEPLWPQIRDFYNISSELQASHLLTRCKEGRKKNIYLTSKAVKDLVVLNQEKIKLINTGVKVFVRCDNKEMGCDFRLAQEGLPSIWPLVSGRVVTVDPVDMKHLLINDDPKTPPTIDTLTEPTRVQVEKLVQGSCVLVCTTNHNSQKPLQFQMVGWRGRISVRAYIPKNEKIHFLRMLGEDVSTLEINKYREKPAVVAGDAEKCEDKDLEAIVPLEKMD